MIRREELFTLEELKRASGRFKTNTALGIDGVLNEIHKEVIAAYPEILLETFNSYLSPIGYDGEAYGEVDFTMTSDSLNGRERFFGRLVQIQER